ncbi:Hpt domain-containing protein [Peptoclostridium litorale DSM 5388]|uniref:HPt domain-containing protein n=1 Tax=Peptoclostridium litorale DSM 5388 TaxID=1121324 RepID=A0A069RN79_PEPLI|nr:Hpt domain-containing protein [Peptoclostridium litorale]KDR95607.1 hypothetical protein CLIT_10c03340 [Peptoclostridium litorale DSM 5388]SIN99299.1 Hpt domain-containing protein [Peptoclostridium litorale DSM 5388]
MHKVIIEKDLEDIVPIFIQSRREDIKNIEALLENGDFGAIKKIGHSMKGVGGGYGFDFISEIGFRLEQKSDQNDRSSVQILTKMLEEYLDHIQIEYE